jgi:hypothetical protein
MQLFRSGAAESSRLSSRTKLLLGAGGLLLFIVGLKRSHRMEDGGTVTADELLARDEDPLLTAGSRSETRAELTDAR